MPTDMSVDELLAELSIEEKYRLVHGAVDPTGRATGYLPGVDRLNIPALRLVDGALGTRIPQEQATAFPAPLTLAATFDTDLAHSHGAALGRETKGQGMDALLVPGTNLIRVPQNGRNFEYFSEDPLHSAAFAAAVTSGIESENVIATPKHYIANSQETYRASVSAEISERALRELYLPSFEASADAGAGSIMTGYNAVNGVSMSEHSYLIKNILKDEFGFEGYVVSDWFATEGAAAAANGGLDIEMPGVTIAKMRSMLGGDEGPSEDDIPDGKQSSEGRREETSDSLEMPPEFAKGMPDPSTYERFAEALVPAVESGEVAMERLDDMVQRVLTVMADRGILDGSRDDSGSIDTDEHQEHARQVATQGTVLLENDNVLPLAEETDIALIGPNIDEAVLGGGGSSEIEAANLRSPISGISDRSKGDVTVASGLPPVEDISMFERPDSEIGDDEPDRQANIEDAISAAEGADVAVVFVRDSASEAIDRESLALPGRQNRLVEAVANANDQTVVVINSSGPVEMPWHEEVAAIVEGWYPGQVHGDAAAAVLYGDTDPGGRLPVTFAPEETYPTADERSFPGENGAVHYEEGVFVGYRWFDSDAAKPIYLFGHGHSYAEFVYGDATLDGETLSVTVENVSDRDGREVVQVYVCPPTEDTDRPERELAGFASIDIPAGGAETARIDLNERAFSHYDESTGWTVDSGTYTIEVGRSSQDTRIELETER